MTLFGDKKLDLTLSYLNQRYFDGNSCTFFLNAANEMTIVVQVVYAPEHSVSHDLYLYSVKANV